MKLYKHIPAEMEDKKTLSKAQLKILNQKDFENNIRKLMEDKGPISMTDAILLYCEKNEVEIETAAALVTVNMKTRLEKEAIDNRMIEKGSAKLPLKEKK